jgi:hypothetical protein
LLAASRSYTGFLPGGQHQMAKTYGQASAATLLERQANDDPLKWRKHVSYAEFTPAHTPAEGHHIPGYSGHVAGVYAENLYAKTYGKTTLKAVSGEFAKGALQSPQDQYLSSNQEMMGPNIPHPGRPTDIAPGGASWSGASPYNVEEPKVLDPVNPWPPSVVQIAGGKEPPQASILLKNFPPTSETREPALRITPKENPHDAVRAARHGGMPPKPSCRRAALERRATRRGGAAGDRRSCKAERRRVATLRHRRNQPVSESRVRSCVGRAAP